MVLLFLLNNKLFKIFLTKPILYQSLSMNKSVLKKAICAQRTACGMGHDCGADKQFTFNMGYGADNLFKKIKFI